MSWLKHRMSVEDQEKVAALEEEISGWDKAAATRLQKIKRQGDRAGVRAVDAELLARIRKEPLPGVTYPTSEVDKRRQLERVQEATSVWEGTPRKRPENPFREALKRVASFGEERPVPEIPADISPDALRELVRTARPEILEKALTHPNLPLDLQEWAVDKFPEMQGASHTLPDGQVMPVKMNLELSKMMNPLAFQGGADPPTGVPWVEEHPLRAGRKKEGPNIKKLRKQSPSLAQLVQERTYPSLEELEAGILTTNTPYASKLYRKAQLPDHLKEEMRSRKHERTWGTAPLPPFPDIGLFENPSAPGEVADVVSPPAHAPKLPAAVASAPFREAVQAVAEEVSPSGGLVHLPHTALEKLPEVGEALPSSPSPSRNLAPWLLGGVALGTLGGAAYLHHKRKGESSAEKEASDAETVAVDRNLLRNPQVQRAGIALGLGSLLAARKLWKRHKAHPKTDEEKTAAPAFLTNALNAVKPIASRSVAPGLVGAGVGAFHGLVSGTLGARDQGMDWGDSIVEGVRAIPGHAAVGGAIGGVGGAISPKFGDRTVQFGKGTLHSLTGWLPKGGFEELGTGSHLVGKQIAAAESAGLDPTHIANLKEQWGALKAVEDKGLTSIPGMVKGVVTKPIDTLRASKDMLFKGLDPFGKFMVGAGIAGGVLPAVLDEDATPAERVGRAARNTAGMLLTTPLQAPVMQAGMNPGLSGMAESFLHNLPGGSVNRLLFAPVDEASKAISNRRGRAAPTGVSLYDDAHNLSNYMTGTPQVADSAG